MATTRLGSYALGTLLIVLAFSGCEKSRELELPARHPVSGTVTYRGQPAVGFRVIFNHVGDIGALKFSPSAITDATGAYKLRSYKPDDGAPLGEYTVTFEWPDHLIKEDDPDPVPEVDKLRGAYSDPKRSTFKATVVEGDNQVPAFNLN